MQEALHRLSAAGVLESQRVGASVIHRVADDHYAIDLLRRLADPLDALRRTVATWSQDLPADRVDSVLLFGSTARGESGPTSDVDLAVVASDPDTDNELATTLSDLVSSRFGNDCDVLVFTPAQLATMHAMGERVVVDIMRDGIVLHGDKPSFTRTAAASR
ncbi:nucleotidyltransferase domain-containing protein [Nocardioides rubriscoriae]|uniref:nucleotidyltransferase domain-containing protein n=1 Tax=Nocardioides rubriscoriae TaxID=642762 RepID=UPI001B8706E3|nr:nucleotidyltransferase domain-containing protein [Nocardioides rubriscoriae]